MLTQEKVKELFDYRDGKLFWKDANTRIKAGDNAGSVMDSGYKRVKIYGKDYLVHRVVWLYHYGYFPGNGLDHIDRNKLNNSPENLREVSQSCNIRNSRMFSTNTSGVKGVFLHKQRKKWVASIKVNNISRHIGLWESFTEAVCHRLAIEQCLGWEGCDSSSPAFQYVQKHITRKGGC